MFNLDNLETRDVESRDLQHLSQVQELRADTDDEGLIEGYIAVWEQVDSYNSQFQRGAFKKTLQNRTDKIKVLYNHDTEKPIGKLIDIREDDHGVFVKAQLILDVESARDTFNLIKGGAIDAFSFGFRTIKDKYENGIQIITEVALGEVSPVVFPAGQASLITGARSTDFDETDKQKELWQSRYRMIDSLVETLDDILWSESEERDSMTSDAIDAFKSAYMNMNSELSGFRSDNKLIEEFRNFCSENNKTIEDLALTTSLTLDELKLLKRGKIVYNKSKLSELSDTIVTTHNELRSNHVEELCNNLREGLSEAEATRINNLLTKSLPNNNNGADNDTISSFLDEFNNSLLK